MTDKKYYELWKKAVCERVRQDFSVELDNNTLLISYLTYIRKCVLYPATIFESLEVKKEISKRPELKKYYDEIKSRLLSGKGVAPYLSKQAKELKPDGLFLDWIYYIYIWESFNRGLNMQIEMKKRCIL